MPARAPRLAGPDQPQVPPPGDALWVIRASSGERCDLPRDAAAGDLRPDPSGTASMVYKMMAEGVAAADLLVSGQRRLASNGLVWTSRREVLECTPCTMGAFSDIALDGGGCWRWPSDKTDMHAFVRRYFEARDEDGRAVATSAVARPGKRAL